MKTIGQLKLFIRVINYKLIDDLTLSNIVGIDKESIYKIVNYDLFVVTNPKDSNYKLEELVNVNDYLSLSDDLKPNVLTGLDAMKYLFKQRNKNIDDYCIESLPLFSNDDIHNISYTDEKFNIHSILDLYRFIDDNNEEFVKLVGNEDNYKEVLKRYKVLQEVVTNFYRFLNNM